MRVRRALPRIGVAVASVFVVGIVVAGLRWSDERSRPTVVGARSVASLPSDPVLSRRGSAHAFNGREILVWGGEDEGGRLFATGAIYDTTLGVWRDLSAGPASLATAASALWTDAGWFICCGDGGAAFLYDDSTRMWRELDAAPAQRVHSPGLVTIEGGVFVVGDDALGKVARPTPVAFFVDLASGGWRAVAAPPTEVGYRPSTGVVADVVTVWARPLGETTAPGLQYDRARGSWATVTAPPTNSWPVMADMAISESNLLVWGLVQPPGVAGRSTRPDAVGGGARYDAVTETWRPMAPFGVSAPPRNGNAGSQSVTIVGRRMIVFTGGMGSPSGSPSSALASYDLDANRWTTLAHFPADWYRPSLFASADHTAVYVIANQLWKVEL